MFFYLTIYLQISNNIITQVITKIDILINTIVLPTSLARPAIGLCSRVTKSTTLSIALFIASAKIIPIKVINKIALFVKFVSIKIITGIKIIVTINSILNEISFFI